MKQRILKSSYVTLSFALAMLFVPGTVFAQEGNENSSQQPSVESEGSTRIRESGRSRAEARKENAEERKSAVKQRLDNAQLKRCQVQEKVVAKSMVQVTERTERHIELVTGVSEKVKAFYVKQGNVLQNYDALVADVDAKKAAAQTALSDLQASGSSFVCNGDDPQGAIATFKSLFSEKRAAMKEYRTAVKALMVGVKSVQPAEPTEGDA